MRLPARLLVLPAVLTLALSGCSGGEETPADEASTPASGESTTAAEEPYLPVPEGVELTTQGSVLELGEPATVAYDLGKDQVGALEITVTSMEEADFDQFVGWELTKQIRETAPYFVRAKVTNVGDTDLGSAKGQRPVPLYGVDDQNRLIESSLFSGSFEPCEDATFPDKFRNGDTMKACMVYLAPDKAALEATSFRPTQEFNPIIWEGELVPAEGSKQGGKQGGAQQGEGRQGGGAQQGEGKQGGGQQGGGQQGGNG